MLQIHINNIMLCNYKFILVALNLNRQLSSKVNTNVAIYVDIPHHILHWLIMHELAMHRLTAGMLMLSKLPLHLFTCVSTDLAS